MTNSQYVMLVRPMTADEGEGFAAYAPELLGCIADGDTPRKAIMALELAMEEWLDEAKRLGRDIPVPGDRFAQFEQEQKKKEAIFNELVSRQDEMIRLLRKEIELLQAQVMDSQATAGMTAWGGLSQLVAAKELAKGRRLNG